ncbi:hypothetical protein D9Q98_001410 [Chlorella vulgaris]|uniref:JmjC domain-containing protein n=1 Tax=Chlorella vulgaris TaxID=3077 RepID=A0A9D4Z219_CHLVU|nr:hypothetical protein D9Q98_001410 [Chlorella vulgaris]
MPVSDAAVLDVLRQLSHDIRDLDVGTAVDRHQSLSAVQFLREYVAANKPVLLTDAISHWPALVDEKWTDAYLCSVAGDAEVTVALTPNGRADALAQLICSSSSSGRCSGYNSGGDSTGSSSSFARTACFSNEMATGDGACSSAACSTTGQCFALPHQVKMPLRNFLAFLHASKLQQAAEGHAAAGRGGAGSGRLDADAVAAARCSPPVPYLQFQNSSLTSELPQLLADIDPQLSWATEAFGVPPEAINLWIGDERSMTSFHSDPYENCYAMVAGSKTFKLLPPSDMYRMRMKQYRLATYKPGGTCEPANSCEPSPAGISREESLDTLTAVLSGSVPLEPVVEQPAQHVLWSSVPPTPVNESGGAGALAADAAGNACDLFEDPSLPAPICVTVHAGETLYLPARWWHQVEQASDAAGRAIAVNYWYDMRFDARQAHVMAVERLAQLLGLNEAPPPPPAASAVDANPLGADAATAGLG